MQHQKKIIPAFKSLQSKPIIFLNVLFGSFWIFFVLFFLTGIIFVVFHSSEDLGLDDIASVTLFFIFFIALCGIIAVLIYSRKKMYTTTIIDEKGIRYLNKFNGKVVKELSWSSFAKRENTEQTFGAQKYDVSSNTPVKSLFDQFFWFIAVKGQVAIHTDAFLGKHFFAMFYANRTELIRTFLLGIAQYRPDINVDPAIFENHYINPETFEIDHKQRKRNLILGLLVMIVIMAGCYFLLST